MASSMMHLAVVQEMKKKIRFQNAERLDLGVILRMRQLTETAI